MKTIHRSLCLLCALALLASTVGTAIAAKSPEIAVQLSRRDLGEQLAENISTGKEALQRARQQTKHWVGPLRARFEEAARDVSAAELRLHESLAAAQNASVSEWEEARAKLAADYDSYSRALTETLRLASARSAEEGRSLRENTRKRW